jgi:C4-dicarboxylate transporter DctM subunit
MSPRVLWDALLETGHITASILFLITAASIYSRMLGLAGLPNELGDMLSAAQMSFFWVMVIYVLLMIFLGTLLDTASIILIVVPLFLPLIEPMGLSLVWFGIVTVVGAEIGLLTPPLGISCFVIKATLNDDRISLKDVFVGAFSVRACHADRPDRPDPLPVPEPCDPELRSLLCATSTKTTSPMSSWVTSERTPIRA